MTETIDSSFRLHRAQDLAADRRADRLAFLRTVPLFADFGPDDLADMVALLREQELRRGQVLFNEGDPGDEMFLVRTGRLVVSNTVVGGVEEVLAHVGAGEVIGEMSFFDGAPRSATVRAESDTNLLVVDRESFDRTIAARPRLAVAFFRAQATVFVERLRASDLLVAETARWGLEATGLDVLGS
jgi:CRP/FNR family transcriptional regulator